MTLSLHDAQLEVFDDPSRVRVVAAGRGCGKTWLALNTAIAFCIGYKGVIKPESPQIVLIATPTLKQGRTLFWIPLLNLLEGNPIVDHINKSDYRIVFKGDRPDLLLRGADLAGQRLRGLNVVFAVCDEFADFHRDVWPVILQPALTRNKDWKALIIGTPKGVQNSFFKFYQDAKKFSDWRAFHFTTYENPFVSRDELARAKAELPPRIFAQEYLSEFTTFEGQLFPDLGDHHKVAELPSEFKNVFVGVDFGDVNPFITVAALTHDGDWYLIDRWKNESSQPVPEEKTKVESARLEKAYSVYRFFLPDDRPATIMAFRRYGKVHGLAGMQRSVQVKRNNPGPMERAEILNTLFYQNKLFFGPRCHDMYEDFISYRRAADASGNLLNKPLKENDHSVDSVAYQICSVHPRTEYLKKKETKVRPTDPAIA